VQLNLLGAFIFSLVSCFPSSGVTKACEQAFKSSLLLEPKEISRVTLEITGLELPQILNGDGSGFRARQVNVRAGSMSFGLHDLPGPLKHILPSAKAYLYSAGEGGKRKSIDLPELMKVKLVEYIRNGGPPKELLNGASECRFDCNSFVHYVTGVSYEYGKFSTDSWTVARIDDQNPIQVGDVILIGYSPKEINHVAINIGDDLYISKFGASGPVLVTDLTTLQMAYGGLGLLSAKPKNKK